MRTWHSFLRIFGLCVILLRPRNEYTQPQPPIFRLDVRVVQVDAQVLNKKTRHAARELKQDDFEIYEDNVRQQVSSFSQDTLPLSRRLVVRSYRQREAGAEIAG